jgi:hypothetical protein
MVRFSVLKKGLKNRTEQNLIIPIFEHVWMSWNFGILYMPQTIVDVEE